MNPLMTKKEWEASVSAAFSAAVESAYKDMIDAAVAAEREACAKVCEDMDLRNRQLRPEHQTGLHNAVRAIRARGEKK